MSVREEDRQKNSCPSRGLGIAAAAIGVGVGAALYYFFNKRQETPNSEGSTSNWQCEQPQTFVLNDSTESHITISEHETTDTSINQTENSNEIDDSEESDPSEMDFSEISDSSEMSEHSEMSNSDQSELLETSDSSTSTNSSEMNDVFMGHSTGGFENSSFQNATPSVMESDTEIEWDVTDSSAGVPEDAGHSSITSLLGRIDGIISRRKKKTEEEQMAILRQEAFRERSWSLEECSICFDVMLRNQDLTSLPCTHNFHTDCIMPWLQEKQTCPNCRKVA
ncbi:dentin sialophosphoprotein isoform X2 [Spodoptera frugiperda]|uniref:Dentin sialophosphoprotein isoform X2 n=1 Tax=Spodoptera frugiperda TaxID=7108 RepID=A0A9R0E5M1_SPOFR|nr:dentin sialophosphoprotein isoform X2 [Spodoptera frugiperda]